LVGAVEDDDSETKSSAQVFGGLGFTSTSGTCWCCAHGQVHGLCKSDVASISQRSNDESTAVTDVFIVVEGSPIADTGNAYLVLVFRLFKFHVELELRLPGEVATVGNLAENEHINNITLVDVDGNDCDNLASKNGIQVLTYTLNEVLDAQKNEVEVIFHS